MSTWSAPWCNIYDLRVAKFAVRKRIEREAAVMERAA